MDLKEEQVLGKEVENHWYYRSKSAAVLKLVTPFQPASILDVGAGSGYFSKYLLNYTTAESALCIDPFYPEERDELHTGKPVFFRQKYTGREVDLVLMMDVLEHVEDDLALLDEYVSNVAAGTRFLITVPAFQFLWSGHDVFLGHYRRYTLSGVTRLAESAGLVVENRAYYFGLIFPLVIVIRLIGRLLGHNTSKSQSDLKKHHPLTNGILSMVCRMELPFFRFNRLAGLSVFCVARKN